MKNIIRRMSVALALTAATAGLFAQAAPNTKLLVGSWKFNSQKSKLVSVQAPKEITRTYEDRGAGSYAYTQVTIGADGTRTESRYTAKDDGSENEMLRVGAGNAPAPTGNTIAFSWTDAYSATQTQTGNGFVVNATRAVSPDGKTMTITVASNAGQLTGAPPPPDVYIFDKQ